MWIVTIIPLLQINLGRGASESMAATPEYYDSLKHPCLFQVFRDYCKEAFMATKIFLGTNLYFFQRVVGGCCNPLLKSSEEPLLN